MKCRLNSQENKVYLTLLFAAVVTGALMVKLAPMSENVPFGMCMQQRIGSACKIQNSKPKKIVLAYVAGKIQRMPPPPPGIYDAQSLLLSYGHIKQKCAFQHAQISQNQTILCMGKALSGPLLSIHTFCSIQWFYQRTVLALISRCRCTGWSGSSLSTYTWRHVFTWCCPYIVYDSRKHY